MMEILEQIKSDLNAEIKNLRNVQNYLNQPYFDSLWITSDEKQRKILSKILEQRDKLKLIDWIRNHPSLELGEKKIRQLKDMAKEKRIPNYSRMSKMELLISLKNLQNEEIKKIEPLSKRDMLIEMQGLLDEMQILLDEARIREDYLMIDPAAIHFSYQSILIAYDWVHDIYDKQYTKAKNIKILLPNELWARYKNWEDFGEHREVVLLTEALQLLRKAIVNSSRPDLFKKTIVKKWVKKLIKEGSLNGTGKEDT